jgi:hypothetical protein
MNQQVGGLPARTAGVTPQVSAWRLAGIDLARSGAGRYTVDHVAAGRTAASEGRHGASNQGGELR